jgi:hypothetical protein
MKTGKSKKKPTLCDECRYDKINKEKNAPHASCCQELSFRLVRNHLFSVLVKHYDSGLAGMTSKEVYRFFTRPSFLSLFQNIYSEAPGTIRPGIFPTRV